MNKIKIIWKDGSISYFCGNGRMTQFIEEAKEYKHVMVAARSARKILQGNSLIKAVRIIDGTTEWFVY